MPESSDGLRSLGRVTSRYSTGSPTKNTSVPWAKPPVRCYGRCPVVEFSQERISARMAIFFSQLPSSLACWAWGYRRYQAEFGYGWHELPLSLLPSSEQSLVAGTLSRLPPAPRSICSPGAGKLKLPGSQLLHLLVQRVPRKQQCKLVGLPAVNQFAVGAARISRTTRGDEHIAVEHGTTGRRTIGHVTVSRSRTATGQTARPDPPPQLARSLLRGALPRRPPRPRISPAACATVPGRTGR